MVFQENLILLDDARSKLERAANCVHTLLRKTQAHLLNFTSYISYISLSYLSHLSILLISLIISFLTFIVQGSPGAGATKLETEELHEWQIKREQKLKHLQQAQDESSTLKVLPYYTSSLSLSNFCQFKSTKLLMYFILGCYGHGARGVIVHGTRE